MFKWLSKIFKTKSAVGNIGLLNADFSPRVAEELSANFGCTTNNDNRNLILVQGITLNDMVSYVDSKINEKIVLFRHNLETNILPSQLEKLKKDVGTITSYKEAISISAIKNDEDFDKILSSVLKERIESDDTDTQNICSLSISTMKNLTKSHFKILSFLYIFRSGYLKDLTSAEQFMEFYNNYFSKLLDMSYEKIRDIGTSILANGCAVQYAIASNLHEIFEEQLLEDVNKLVGNDLLNNLAGIWYQTGLASSFPTEVGKNIAKTYLHEILGIDIISKKINAKDVSMVRTSGDIANIYKFE